MADSDNSRTLSPVTREDFHSFIAASLTTETEHRAWIKASRDGCDDDPALETWREWQAARELLVESCLRQQRLETKLFSMAGCRSKAPEAWEAADREVGYSEALEAERRASIVEDDLAETLWNTPAQSVAGATAKLHAMVNKWQPSISSDEYPWPQIRSVITDLLKIDQDILSRERATSLVA